MKNSHIRNSASDQMFPQKVFLKGQFIQKKKKILLSFINPNKNTTLYDKDHKFNQYDMNFVNMHIFRINLTFEKTQM